MSALIHLLNFRIFDQVIRGGNHAAIVLVIYQAYSLPTQTFLNLTNQH